MVQSFRTAERVLIDAFCIFCIRSSFNSAEQRSRILAIGAVLDKVEMATLDAYLETQRQLQQDHNNSTAVLVTRLPGGSAADRVEIDAQARLVGANPSLPYRCVALSLVSDKERDDEGDVAADWDATDPTPRLTRLRRHVMTRLIEARVPAPIVGIYDESLILLVPVTRRDAMAAIRRAVQATQYRQNVVGGAGDVYGNLFDARVVPAGPGRARGRAASAPDPLGAALRRRRARSDAAGQPGSQPAAHLRLLGLAGGASTAGRDHPRLHRVGPVRPGDRRSAGGAREHHRLPPAPDQ
jgi:hypothetical protein